MRICRNRTPPLSGSGARRLLAKCDPFLRPAAVLEGSIVSSLPLVTMSLLDVGFLHETCAGAAQFVGLLDARTMSTPRLVTAWSRWLQANSHIWVTLLAIRSWRPVILEIDIFASSTGELNIITVAETVNLHDSGLCRLHRVREYDW